MNELLFPTELDCENQRIIVTLSDD